MKPVFEYFDYRDYLKDFYNERKATHSFFSYRYFGNKIEVDSSYLLKVLLKKRHLSEQSITRVIPFCGLSGTEAEYFHTLFFFNKAKTQRESRLHFEKLLAIRNVNSRLLEDWQYEYFCTWYHPVVRSILEYFDFKGDYAILGKQLSPPISAKEAKASVELLKALDLITCDENGHYSLTDNAVTTGDEWHSLAISAFQEQTIRLSMESLERHDRSLRDISTITMNINSKNFEEIRKRITEFRRSIIAYASECNDPDRTYQLNIQLFPLTQTNGGKQ